MNFYVVRCKECGRYTGTQIKNFRKKIFICVYCRKRLKLKKVNEYGLTTQVSGPYSSNQIAKAVQILNTPKNRRRTT